MGAAVLPAAGSSAVFEYPDPHASHVFTADANGENLWADRYSPQYDDIAKFQNPNGLKQLIH